MSVSPWVAGVVRGVRHCEANAIAVHGHTYSLTVTVNTSTRVRSGDDSIGVRDVVLTLQGRMRSGGEGAGVVW
jgi:hypothetical protein